MGLEERGASICFTTLPSCAGGFWTLNEIALPIVPTGTISFTLTGKMVVYGSFSPQIMRRQRLGLCHIENRFHRATSDAG
jgi:hypothetical protein